MRSTATCLADKDITVVSVNDEITITSSKRVEKIGGDSKVVLDSGNIDFVNSGAFIVNPVVQRGAGSSNERLHAHHLHITVHEPKIL